MSKPILNRFSDIDQFERKKIAKIQTNIRKCIS